MRVLLTALAASIALATPAMAQDWDRGHRDRDRYEDRDHRDYRDHRRGDRDWDRHDRRDRWERRNWRRGDRFEGRDCDNYRRVDHRRYHLRQPPRGMYYVMDDRGDILLVLARSNVVIAVNIR